MDVYHGTWIPTTNGGFENRGEFFFWVERQVSKSRKSKSTQSGICQHPNHVSQKSQLDNFLSTDLSLKKTLLETLEPLFATAYAVLPSDEGQPFPSLEMARLSGHYLPDKFAWQQWEIKGLSIKKPLLFLRELQFIASLNPPNFRLGSDLLFWIQYAQQCRNMVRQHQLIPTMKCHQSSRKGEKLKVYCGWSPFGTLYERGVQDFAAAMPGICTTISEQALDKAKVSQPECLDSTELLRHFAEQQIEQTIFNTPFTQKMLKRLGGNWLVHSLNGSPGKYTLSDIGYDESLTTGNWKQWNAWQRNLTGQASAGHGFVLGLRLQPAEEENDWLLHFFVESAQDPSLRIDLAEWWNLSDIKQKQWLKQLGHQFERTLLVNMGQAARICPMLWQGMESTQPASMPLSLNEAYDFLKNDAAVLESAGFKIVLPGWWTPQGRKRARIRVKASGKSGSSSAPLQEKDAGTGYFALPSLVEYRYELAVAGEAVSEQEWQELVNAKSPLVQFRGEWMELDSGQMTELLALWQKQSEGSDPISIGELLKQAAEVDEETTEFVFDEVLERTLGGLQQQSSIEPVDNPKHLQGELRTYQKQGLSWLATQEALGLNPCLADDMGLGKTIQIIALLLHEREGLVSDTASLLPTLLIAPTSVLGNWQKEIEKFAPSLRSVIHHGSKRASDAAKLTESIAGCDVVITSFTIARKDSKLFDHQSWQRVVVDEAQNIKNPKSAQAKAIYALKAPHRIAMTGTPIENRLMDMWSLFHFLNPGYLGTAAQFKKAYETPVQREGDVNRSRQLKRLVHPFILRRLKSDKSIISDLPDKLEQKVYCNLTKEQASLYQAVVDDVQAQIEDTDGIQRKGLILSTLMRLKQVCNHPAQFLQDGSEFSESRSHKLTRLNDMAEEALQESDSLLVFTQFTEIGSQLEALLRENHRCPVYYLHGGTSRSRREQMIEEFQNPDTPAGIFILSLKAGGVGITLTRANHVFHFDRWWNPAVENQATDRAYRIGQEKTVFAHKMVTLGTLEERIDKMLEEKQALADNIVGNDESWLTEMDNAAFQQLIQLNRTTIMEA